MALRVDIDTIAPHIAHNNNIKFGIGCSSIHNNNRWPRANNKKYIETSPTQSQKRFEKHAFSFDPLLLLLLLLLLHPFETWICRCC